ncbi:MAG: trypsin-like peptidase domain-containing protein [Bacteroidota bacterium]
MSKRNFFVALLLSSVFGGLIVLVGVFYFVDFSASDYKSIEERQNVVLTTSNAEVKKPDIVVPNGLNFILAAEKSIPGVVHIRSQYSSGEYSFNPLENLFRDYQGGNRGGQSSGSGVIISDDGFVATNYHVIEDASRIEVILNDNRRYFAKVVGKDPTTDLALLKIKANGLQFVEYGNSDDVYPGEWVLAVGNPFTLNSTVTAGIVSAKARNIGILRDRNNLQIESFIQTDAAVNPGNSGGALVNLRGELIGINTAIATSTGTYAGYSFAVPVTLVKKVMDDLLEFGAVQRGLLGIRIQDVSAQIAELEGLDLTRGVYVSYVNDNSAAEDAGLTPGDVIIGVNDVEVGSVAELQEIVARNRPGDEIKVTYSRSGIRRSALAILKNTEGSIRVIKRTFDNKLEGATFENLSLSELTDMDLEGGVMVTDVDDGKWKDAGVEEGFIIISIDKVEVDNIEELHRIMENKRGGVLVEGINKSGKRDAHGLKW